MFKKRRAAAAGDQPVILQRKQDARGGVGRTCAAIPLCLLLLIILGCGIVDLIFANQYHAFYSDDNYSISSGWHGFTSSRGDGSLWSVSFAMWVIGWLIFAASLGSIVFAIFTFIITISGRAGYHTLLICLIFGLALVGSYLVYIIAAVIEFKKYFGRTLNADYSMKPNFAWVLGIVSGLLWLVCAGIAACMARRKRRGPGSVLVQQGDKVYEVPLTKTGQLPPSLAAQHPVDPEAGTPAHGHSGKGAAGAGAAAGAGVGAAAVAEKKRGGFFGRKKHAEPTPATTQMTPVDGRNPQAAGQYGSGTGYAENEPHNLAPGPQGAAVPSKGYRTDDRVVGQGPGVTGPAAAGAAGGAAGTAAAVPEKKRGGLFGRKKEQVVPSEAAVRQDVPSAPPAGQYAPDAGTRGAGPGVYEGGNASRGEFRGDTAQGDFRGGAPQGTYQASQDNAAGFGTGAGPRRSATVADEEYGAPPGTDTGYGGNTARSEGPPRDYGGDVPFPEAMPESRGRRFFPSKPNRT